MNEPFLLGLVVAGLIAAAIAVRMTSREHHLPALSRLEAKLEGRCAGWSNALSAKSMPEES